MFCVNSQIMRIILIFLLSFSGFIVAQTKEYPFYYKLDLGSQPSTCFIEYDTACPQEFANWSKVARDSDYNDTLLSRHPNVDTKSTINFFDRKLNPVPFVRVKFINENHDTLIRISNFDGVLKDVNDVFLYEISIKMIEYTPIVKNIPIVLT